MASEPVTEPEWPDPGPAPCPGMCLVRFWVPTSDKSDAAGSSISSDMVGRRLVQIWVPDVNSPEFAAEAHRESLLIAEADRRSDDLDFWESISDPWDDD